MEMADASSFELGVISAALGELRQELRAAVVRSRDAQVAALVGELDETSASDVAIDAAPLTITFVGQYNAGKSTILSVLTGREDIPIDSDVCTDEVRTEDWNGIRLLDTPGVHAGRPDHDERTKSAIDRSDLLIFVVTNELFDDTIGGYFRELAFERNHDRRMLLVVNKMSQDAGSPETKRPDIEKVTAPNTLEDFRAVFIDARSFLEAQAADDEDRAELQEIANIPSLNRALNAFVAERGFAGRLSAPLFKMRNVAEHAFALLATDLPQERAALELLHRKRGLLLASRSRLRAAMEGIVARAVADIGRYGDEVAEGITPGRTGKEVEAQHTSAQDRARNRSEQLSAEARQCVELELDELGRQLQALRAGVLARELAGQMVGDAPDVELGSGSPSWQADQEAIAAEWSDRVQRAGDVAKDIGNWAARWASGPKAANTASPFSITAASGSEAHKMVYNVGKFFGVKFKPYGAVKVAAALGNAGRVIGAAGAVLGVVAQIAEDRQQDQYRLQLRNARDGVRSAYRDSACSMEAAFWAQFETFAADFYGSELAAIGDRMTYLIRGGTQRETEANIFEDLGQRATALIERITADQQLPVAA